MRSQRFVFDSFADCSVAESIRFSPDSFCFFNLLNLHGKFRGSVALRHFAGKAYCLCQRALPCVVRAARISNGERHGKQMKSIRG
ncbi:hypothetical protein AGR4B_Cc10139 [Agrobacterium tumefaciens str. CFBP 5621]|nr:hypothetical protein AGR4B_Cc10139 [Agrobacterium tumefaciens str. CFBP 5621]